MAVAVAAPKPGAAIREALVQDRAARADELPATSEIGSLRSVKSAEANR